jgi:hypothetical protein
MVKRVGVPTETSTSDSVPPYCGDSTFGTGLSGSNYLGLGRYGRF